MENISLNEAQKIAQIELEHTTPARHFTLVPGDVQEFAFG